MLIRVSTDHLIFPKHFKKKKKKLVLFHFKINKYNKMKLEKSIEKYHQVIN